MSSEDPGGLADPAFVPGPAHARGRAARAGLASTRARDTVPDPDGTVAGDDGTLAPEVETPAPDPRFRILRLGGMAVMAICLVGAVAFSTLLYHRAYLSEDFGAYNQAWSLIGHGHLNPYETIFSGYPFYKSDLELIMWPLALIHVVFPQPIILLWIQDVAVVGTALVVYLWILDFLQSRHVAWWPAAAVSIAVLTALIVNPGVYQTLLFDFHMEPISTFLLVLAARDLWNGRHRRAWIWVAVALLCGTFAAITVGGLGISALLAGRATRRQGLYLIGAAGVWLVVVSAVGANVGAGLTSYAYLAGRATLPQGSGMLLVIEGALLHPSRVVHQLHLRFHYIYLLLKPVGVIGIASAWGFGIPFVVLMTNAMNSNYEFVFQAFQNSAVFPFVLFGTVTVLVWLAQRFRAGWIPAVLVALAVTVQAVAYGVTTSPGNVRWAISRVSAAQGGQLRKALSLTPANAEVIASIGIMGRFSARPSVYWFQPNAPVPVRARTIVFVFDPSVEDEISETGAPDDLAADDYVRTVLHARVLVDSQGITAFEWRPPGRTRSVTIKGPTPG